MVGRLPRMDHRRAGVLRMTRFLFIYLFFITAFLGGCTSPEEPAVVLEEDIMLFLQPGLRPESVLFPEYLLIEDLEIDVHGKIPKSPLVAGGLKTKQGLKTVLSRYNAVLKRKGWQIAPPEIADHSFRLMADRPGETVEIRAVQGTGWTHIFILYRPIEPHLPTL